MSIRREFIVHQSSRGRSHPEPIYWSARDHYAVDYDLRHLPTAELEKSGRVVRDAEIRPSIGPPAEAKLDMAALGNRVDGVVDQIGSDFAEQQRVGPDAYVLRRFAQANLHLLRSGPGACHSHGPREELVQVNRFRGEADAGSGGLGERAQNGDGGGRR